MVAELVFNDGRLFALDPEAKFYTIGRSLSCSISGFKDLAVSNRHATAYFNDRQNWQITDGDMITGKTSRGGLLINGTRLNPEHGYELQHNDLVEMSSLTSFKFFCFPNTNIKADGDTLL